MKKSDTNHSISMNIFHSNLFAILKKSVYSVSAVAKSTAEPENSNNLSVANNSAPCAFFIRNLHTPKESAVKFNGVFLSNERTFPKNRARGFLPMVACNGKGFALCCVPLIAVSQPVTRYRPKPENFSVVTSSKSSVELSAMIYLFKAVNRSDLRNTAKHYSDFPKYNVRINADTLAQARAKIAPFFVVLGVVYA